MGSYILNFTVYTMAMCGLIFFALFIYKKFADGGIYSKNSKFLKVEDTLSIGPRKTLYVVKAGNEKFLIAGDAEKTSLISKLEINNSNDFETQLQQAQLQPQRISNYAAPPEKTPVVTSENHQTDDTFKGIDDLPQIVDFPKRNKSTKSGNVIQSMIAKVKE